MMNHREIDGPEILVDELLKQDEDITYSSSTFYNLL
jgi:hypothetical protein